MLVSEAQELNRILSVLEPADFTGEVMVDTFHLPYVRFDEAFVLPPVKLHDIQFEQARAIVELLARLVPGYVAGCQVLPEARPRRDTDQLHLVRRYGAGEREYIFIFKVILKYMGGAADEEIVAAGAQGVTPSIRSDRLYFETRLLPVRSVTEQDGAIVDFQSLHIKDALFKIQERSPGTDIWSTMLFDEVDFSKINRRFTELLAFETEWKMPRLFWPFAIEYLSLCLNLVHPDRRLVDFMMPYFHRAFEALLPGTLPLAIPEEDRAVWRSYYDSWSYEPRTSRGGNPHWALLSLPDHRKLPA